MEPPQRQALAVAALAGARPITQLAQEYQVSRKFVYQQAGKADQALTDAFAGRGLRVLLVAEGFHQEIPKGYVYFAMAFALVVDLLQMRADRRTTPAAPSEPGA